MTGMPPTTLAGRLAQSGKLVSGAVHVDGSHCFDWLTTIDLTGTLSGNSVSLTSASVAGEITNLTGNIGSKAYTGTYDIKGGCADNDHGSVTGTKLPVMDGDVADFAVVAATEPGGRTGLFLVDLKGAGVTRTPLTTVDPTRSHARLVFDGAAAEPLGAPGAGWPLVERLLDRAAVLVAFEQLGGAQAALDMAREYAIGRFAFGRQIASFQAIKHKLADMYVAVELARSNAYYGAWALSKDAPELPVAAATARVAATEAYYQAAKENIQVHGGMGFTWEFDCHLHYRRAKLTGLMLGSARRWKDLLVARLEAGAA
jgi:alkylation response protein AidB-like acyl-CoA dehydrogenase